MKLKNVNENIFGSAKRFTDVFFDRLKNNSADRMLKQLEKQGKSPELVRVMADMQRDKDKLDAILARIDKNISQKLDTK